jgi:hypothetical protein
MTYVSSSKRGGLAGMWCAVRVESGDGQMHWLAEANGDGARSLVVKFENAAIFWRRERAQSAIDGFLKQDNKTAQSCSIVDLDGDFYKRKL